jgi:hypothetical protein
VLNPGDQIGRNGNLFALGCVFDHIHASPYGRQQACDIDTVVFRLIRVQFRHGLRELAPATVVIPILEVVVSHGDLNQPLQEEPVVLPVLVPELFENVVRFEEAALIKLANSSRKSFIVHDTIVPKRCPIFKEGKDRK